MKSSIGTFVEWTKLREMTPDQGSSAWMAINTNSSASQQAMDARKFLGTQSKKAVTGTSDFVNALTMIATEKPALLIKVIGAITSAIRSLQDENLDQERKESLIAALRSSIPGLKQLEAPAGTPTTPAFGTPTAIPIDTQANGVQLKPPLGNIKGVAQ